jgi:CBS domain-containing protein
MKKIAAILQRKGAAVVTVAPDTTVLEAIRIMAEKNIGSVVVADKDRFMGIVSERDYSRKVILKGKHSSETKVSEIMSTDLPSLRPEDSIDQCMNIMSQQNLRYLPVFDKEGLAGIISMSDVVKETILAQKETINQLENYIHGQA